MYMQIDMVVWWVWHWVNISQPRWGECELFPSSHETSHEISCSEWLFTLRYTFIYIYIYMCIIYLYIYLESNIFHFMGRLTTFRLGPCSTMFNSDVTNYQRVHTVDGSWARHQLRPFSSSPALGAMDHLCDQRPVEPRKGSVASCGCHSGSSSFGALQFKKDYETMWKQMEGM